MNLQLSPITYGVWRLADDPEGHAPGHVLAKIDACLECGITTFDHADIYGDYRCERLFGEALAARPELRDEIQLVTKCDIQLLSDSRPKTTVKHYDTSAEHIQRSVEMSLRNLRTDSIDLLLLHRPDPLMDPNETAAALERLVGSGKVRQLGVSNFSPSQVDLLQSRLEQRLVCNQIELSLLRTAPLTNGTLDHCQQHHIRVMAWSPLGGGRLFDEDDELGQRLRGVLENIRCELDAASIDQVALAWLLRHPCGIVPVIGTNQIDRIRRAAAATRIEMTRQQWFRLLEASWGHEVP